MSLEVAIGDLSRKAGEHRSKLATEEAAKTAFVMPFIKALGYDLFDPEEVVPEFTADVGTKKGEKVDYAIFNEKSVQILIECKPADTELSVSHASQLFRYFTVTSARLAVLTNGIEYQFFADLEKPNIMDQKPFFVFKLESVKKSDIKTLASFSKGSFDIDKIVKDAGHLKQQSMVYRELQKELSDPSDEFVRLIGKRVHSGHLTSSVKDILKSFIASSFQSLVREGVSERLESALTATNAAEEPDESAMPNEAGEVETTEDEILGYNIIRAIGAEKVDIRRIVMRDSKSYCAILLDDNNRKTVARLWFNSSTTRYLGTFLGKDETKVKVDGPTDIYKYREAILLQLSALTEGE